MLILYGRADPEADGGIRYFSLRHTRGDILVYDTVTEEYSLHEAVTGRRVTGYEDSLTSWIRDLKKGGTAVVALPQSMLPHWYAPQVDEGQ